MKVFFISLIMMCCNFLLMMAQQDEIYFYYDKYGYKEVAQERFMNLYSTEKRNKVHVFSTTMISNKYKEEELDSSQYPFWGGITNHIVVEIILSLWSHLRMIFYSRRYLL